MTMQKKAERIFDHVVAAGAEADLIVNTDQSLSLKANQGELEQYEVSSTQIFGLRVLQGGKVGLAYSEDDSTASLQSMAEQALSNAQFSAPDANEQLLPNTAQLESDDALLYLADDSSTDEKIDFILALESDLMAKPLIKNVPYNGVSDSTSERYVFSTAGLVAHSRSRSYTANAYALAEKGDANAMEGKGQFARQFKQLDKEVLVEQIYTECAAMLDGKPVASKHYDVIFDRESQSSLFGVFSAVFSGKWAKEGINPWRDSLGKVVADERLQIFDNPLLQAGSSYKTFDAEGSQTQRNVLINNGVLETLLHNSVTARFYGVENTGNAVRGAKSALGVSMHQREVAAGDADTASLRAGEFIEVTQLSGLHSGANPISGDFSLGASGYLCRDGERIQAVRGITVAGNFYTMLNNIAAIGDTQYWNWSKSVLMPSIRFNALAISG